MPGVAKYLCYGGVIPFAVKDFYRIPSLPGGSCLTSGPTRKSDESLLLIDMLEAGNGMIHVVHALCIALIVGRLLHAYGVGGIEKDYRFRVFGMPLTLTAISGAALGVLVVYAPRFFG